MNPRDATDREFLRFFAVVVNRAILRLQSSQSLRSGADFRVDRPTAEALLEDGRRLVQAYRIWRRKKLGPPPADFALLARDLVRVGYRILVGTGG